MASVNVPEVLPTPRANEQLPPDVWAAVQRHLADDPEARATLHALVRRRLAANPPKAGQAAHSDAQRWNALGMARKIYARLSGLWPDPDDLQSQRIEELLRPRSQARATRARLFAIERRAVALAIAALTDEGWQVEDVGTSHSYDLDCTRPSGEHLIVEVKGTTGPLGEVTLTRNEVMIATTFSPNTALYVVHGIALKGAAQSPMATGGTLYIERPFFPDEDRLQALAYRYTPRAI